MFNLQIAQRLGQQQNQRAQSERRHNQWLRKYHNQVRPKLLQHYEARIQSFLRQIEVQPFDPTRILKNPSNNNCPSLKFKVSATCGLKQKYGLHLKEKSTSILRSSEYTPICNYQFRSRQKQKQIKSKVSEKTFLYRKMNKNRPLGSRKQGFRIVEQEEGRRSKMRESRHRVGFDNRSDLTFQAEDNLSIRYSNNSYNENIEKQARQYQRNQQLIQRKKHYKYLTNLQQLTKDPSSKNAIHQLLVKAGIHRPKFKTQHHQSDIDLFNLQTGRSLKISNQGRLND